MITRLIQVHESEQKVRMDITTWLRNAYAPQGLELVDMNTLFLSKDEAQKLVKELYTTLEEMN